MKNVRNKLEFNTLGEAVDGGAQRAPGREVANLKSGLSQLTENQAVDSHMPRFTRRLESKSIPVWRTILARLTQRTKSPDAEVGHE